MLNAQAISNAERAWVEVKQLQRSVAYFEFYLSNIGRTPARIVRHYIRFEFQKADLDLPTPLPTPEQLFKFEQPTSDIKLLGIGEERWVFETMDLSRAMAPDLWEKVRSLKADFILYGT